MMSNSDLFDGTPRASGGDPYGMVEVKQFIMYSPRKRG